MSSDESDSEDEDGDSAAASSMSRLKLNQGLSEDDFKQLIVDIAAWYDGLRHIGMLKVLFKDIVDDTQTLERATTVIALLSQLVGPGKLNRNNLTILYDTVKVTKQSGFKSTIKEKLYHFKNIDTLQVTSFTKHRINILNFGKELTDSNIEFLDGRYNFPGLKMYKDSWSLITDLEIKGILKEENIEAFRKVLQQNGMESADRCFIHDEEMGTSQSKRQMTRYQDEDMGPSLPKRQKIRNKDEIIREYLFEQQRKFCIKANEFTPAIMQSRYKVDIAHMFTDLDLMKENQRKIDPKPIKLDELLSVIKSTPTCKVLIDGEGGIGKTTLLRYLSYGWAKETDLTFQGKILFLVNIRDINSGEDILDVMVKRIKLKHFSLKTELPANPRLIKKFILDHENEIVLFLDGLDELKIGVDDPINLIKGEEMENCVVILTSRSENIDEYIKESDVHVKVKGFNPENIKKYITKHFKYFEAPDLGKSLIEELELNEEEECGDKHPEVYSMCRNPMLLLSVCIMWEEKKYLPTEKTVLFEGVFRSILNQYNREENNDQNIDEFQDTPSELIDAMLVLGRGMYESLKINQLYINRKRLKGNKDTIALALKLGFLYKDSPTSKDDFKDTFAAPHKLLLEALVGFYFHKLSLQTGESLSRSSGNMNEKEIMETDLLLDEGEWDSIIDNDHLKVAREFAIGFLGSSADKFLNHWITNSLTTYRSLISQLRIVKEEHRVVVENALSAHLSTSNVSIKPHIDRVCGSLKRCAHHMIQDVSEDYQFIDLLRNIHGIGPVFSEPLQACFAETDTLIKVISNESSSKEKGIMLAHIMIAVPYQSKLLERVHETWGDSVIEHLNSECKKLDFKYDVTSYSLYQSSVTSSFLTHLLSKAPKLEFLNLDESITSVVINEMLKEITSRGHKLALKKIFIRDSNLSNVDGSLLASLLMFIPKLNNLCMIKCSLSGGIMNTMIKKCYSSGQKLLLDAIDISDNYLDNLCGSSLASLMVMAPKLKNLDMHNCRLPGHVFNDMVKSFSGKISLELERLNIGNNNLSSTKGTSLAYIMSRAPKLNFLQVERCNLSGNVFNDMTNSLSGMDAKLELRTFNVAGNNLNQLDGASLASLISITPKLSDFRLSDCTLDGEIINAMYIHCCNSVKLELTSLDLSSNNLSTINGTLLASLLGSVLQTLMLDMSSCNLSGQIINDMMEKLSQTSHQLNLNDLNMNGNCLTNVTGYSMALLFTTFSELDTLRVQDSGLSGITINDMVLHCVDSKLLLKLIILDLSGNNLSKISGCSLASLFAISPELTVLNMNKCSLSGIIIDNMIIECTNRRITMKLNVLGISCNNLTNINHSQLPSLVNIAPEIYYINLYKCSFPDDIKQFISNEFSKTEVDVNFDEDDEANDDE